MADNMMFSTENAVVSNLSRLARESSIISEQRILELCDIAAAMVEATLELIDNGLDIYEALSVLTEDVAFGDYPISDDTLAEHRDMLKRGLDTAQRTDRASLTELYLTGLKSSNYLISESNFLPTSQLPETFTYVRNALSDEAYDVFSQDFTDPKVRYCASFRECVASVTSEEVGYCLLPLEERGGTRLPTVSEIIFRNDFRINSVIPVFGPDGSADMKYALISKSFTVPQRRADDDLYLEIRLGVDNDSALAEVFAAVDYFGMKLYRVNTVTFDTEGERETYFSLVIKDGGNGFTQILTYLSLFIRDFAPVGIYKNLEE